MSDVACNFVLLSTFNAKHDIQWSFKYSLCGAASATGGFATFLIDGDVLSGGGVRSGLGFGPYDVRTGVSALFAGVGFDATNQFATLSNGFNTGSPTPSANCCTLRVGQQFTYIASAPLDWTLISPNVEFKTLRFTLTDLGQSLVVDVLNQGVYQQVARFNTGTLIIDDRMMSVGVSFASPVTGASRTDFQIQDFHYQGLR